MCGIVGVLGKKAVAEQIIDALKRLEYRGYDSAGIATLENGTLARRRAEGKLGNLETRLSQEPLSGLIGIGHTRWATHGRPTERNAHPHATKRLAVVHNGIIENFRALRAELEADGYLFETETDTEAVAQLVTRELDRGRSPVEAVGVTLKRLKGAFALAFMFSGEEDLLIGARAGAPLAVGFGEGEMYLGSDALALAPFTDRISFLEECDWVVLNRHGAEFRDAEDRLVNRVVLRIATGSVLIDRGNYRHFMAKEIHEQPEVVAHTLAHYLDLANGKVRLPEKLPFNFRDVTRLYISACGTSYYAGLIAKYWFERIARLSVDIDIASEFRYREPPLPEGGLAIFISQSGETADTLASLRYAKSQRQHTLSIVNVTTSTVARESEAVTPTIAGVEVGVASTKAFTCQLAVLACLALAAGVARGTIDAAMEGKLVESLMRLPGLMAEVLKDEHRFELLARDLAKAEDILYLGRGTSFPIALEGALKLKEISYIHAEGYAAGELKHGPIALIDEKMPVIVTAPHDQLFDKTVSNVQEVAARGGRIIVITDEAGARDVGVATEATILMPTVEPLFAPILYALPVQLLAYHTALVMGKDVDQPRNLAKSVTVE
jgi:glucosamine--fructose-6-phosphate aminotransferase (isomerizing)